MNHHQPHILIVEDDAILGGAISQRLKLEGFQVTLAETCAAALAAMKRQRHDFVLSDIVLPDGSGEDLYREAQSYLGSTPVLFATAYGEIEQAVRLVKAGADDYLTKPYSVDDLLHRISGRLLEKPGGSGKWASVNFASAPATEGIADQLRRAANTDLPVLICGETGTGKEVAARFLHAASSRARSPFVPVNCGAIPHDLLESQFFGHEQGAFTGATQSHVGSFEEAGDGTLFLDEVSQLDAKLQTTLLRTLEDGSFRPVGSQKDRRFAGRIVAATNADLKEMRARKAFRDDLYYRLSVVEIHLPPLRERVAEIESLAKHFLKEAVDRLSRHTPSLSEEALSALLRHGWPGNIRELRNRLQRAIVLAPSETLEADSIFPELILDDPSSSARTLAAARRQAETDQIEQALALSHGRVGEAAKRLGISRTTLWKRRSERKDQ